MTVVVLGIDALDPDILKEGNYPNLELDFSKSIDTILSRDTGRPSTHELWPTIFTGLTPEEHGLEIGRGLEWENPLINYASKFAGYVLPKGTLVKVGGWIIDNTEEGVFRAPATYFERNNISTIFDETNSKQIGVPNYVTDPDEEDREHELRKNLGNLFQLDFNDETNHRHVSSDPQEFYERCLEMSMVRIALTRRALRGRRYELVFGYTSGLDLVGHIAYEDPSMQTRAYEELDEFVGELRGDLEKDDELLLVSDHGLQKGEHTEEAMVASTSRDMVEEIDSVLDVRDAIENELARGDHESSREMARYKIGEGEKGEEVKEHLEDLGYM